MRNSCEDMLLSQRFRGSEVPLRGALEMRRYPLPVALSLVTGAGIEPASASYEAETTPLSCLSAHRSPFGSRLWESGKYGHCAGLTVSELRNRSPP